MYLKQNWVDILSAAGVYLSVICFVSMAQLAWFWLWFLCGWPSPVVEWVRWSIGMRPDVLCWNASSIPWLMHLLIGRSVGCLVADRLLLGFCGV